MDLPICQFVKLLVHLKIIETVAGRKLFGTLFEITAGNI